MFSHGPATVQPKISSNQSFPFELVLLIFCVMPFLPLCFTQAYHITAFRNEIGSAYLITPMQLVGRNRIGMSQKNPPSPIAGYMDPGVERPPDNITFAGKRTSIQRTNTDIVVKLKDLSWSNKHDLRDDGLNAGMCCSASI